MKTIRNIICLCLAAAIVVSGILPSPSVFAKYTKSDLANVNSKIAKLRSKMNEYENQASALASEADSIENEISKIKNQLASLQTKIELKEAEHEKLVAEIEVITKRINDNSETVGYTIAQYYYNDEVSTIERIASADSFSSFIDEEMEFSNISDMLSSIIEENKNLKAELETKKKNAELILEDLKTQKGQLAQLKKEQGALLAQTRETEASYRQLKAEAATQKAALEEQQQKILSDLERQYNASNIVAGDPNKGGYPYSGNCPRQKDAFIDQWGMYICECVSYAAWKVHSTYGYMPYWGGRGHAKQWPANARAAGYTVSSTPKANTVGISTGGAYGHAVWVEAVSGGRVYISQYNARNAATNYQAGEYSEQWVDQGMYQYIYFGK